MRRKKISCGVRGWILAELMCCVMVTALFSAILVQAASLVVRTSGGIHEAKTSAADYESLSHEIDAWAVSGDRVALGQWRGEISRRQGAGTGEADVRVEKSADGRPVAVRWKLWNIKGRK